MRLRVRLKELADERGLKLRFIAQKTGIAEATLYAISSNPNYNATLRTIEKLCEFFGVTPNELLEIEEENPE